MAIDQEKLLDRAFCLKVREADPLYFDKQLVYFVRANRDSNLSALNSLLCGSLDACENIQNWSDEVAAAVLRDLGLVGGAIRRLGKEPCEIDERLAYNLKRAASVTKMVPRDTVYHYGLWNPRGKRERSYTGELMESTLIESVRESCYLLGIGVEICVEIKNDIYHKTALTQRLSALSSILGFQFDCFQRVATNVDPKFFSVILRPYFESFCVGDEEYFGPAAAHVGSPLIDLALWQGESFVDTSVRSLCKNAAQYGVYGWDELFERWIAEPSIIDQIFSKVVKGSEHEDHSEVKVNQLCVDVSTDCLRNLLKFRGRHLSLAKKSYNSNFNEYRKGSAGETIEFLISLFESTQFQFNRINKA